MTHLLPPNLLRLFAPRPPIPYLKPLVRDPEIPLHKRLDGVAGIIEELREENALRDADKEAKLNAEQKAAEAEAAKSKDGSDMQVDSSGKAIKVKKEQVNGVKKEDAEMEEGEEPSTTAIKEEEPESTAKAAIIKEEPVLATDVPAGEALLLEEKGLLVDDSGEPFTYTVAEKQRQRRLLRKRRREEDFAKALETCKGGI